MRATEHVEYLLRQGRKTKELIELGFSKSAITRVRRKLKKERNLKKTEATKRITMTKRHADPLSKPPGHTTAPGPKLEFTESQWRQINNLLNTLPDLAGLMAVIRVVGIEEREVCRHIEDGVCTQLAWDSEDDIPEGIGEPVLTDEEKPRWGVKPSIYYCALCTVRIEDRLDRI